MNYLEFQNAVLSLGYRNKRKVMLEDARAYGAISSEDFDRDGNLLNCRNCTIDLKTFNILEHNPEHLLTKCCNVDYKEGARSVQWEKFLDDIMMGDTEKIRYLQKICGYALTTDTDREEAYILWGSTTRNGKSTFCEVIGKVMGDYAMSSQPEILALKTKDSRQASGDIARLAGCRLLRVSEPPKKMILDSALLKTLIGNDTITARHLHEREFQFQPTFKLLINTNYLPLVGDDTIFSSERIKVITFDRHFEEHEQDRGLKLRLQTEDNLSGILNWCLEGLKLYRKEGLKPPESVRAATAAYRKDSDKLANFIEDCLVDNWQSTLRANDVYEEYQRWCRACGFGIDGKMNFFSDLRTKGLLSPSGTIGGVTVRNVVKGYSLSDFSFPIHNISSDDTDETPFD